MSRTRSDSYDDPFQRYSYRSDLIEALRSGDGELVCGRVTVRVARTFGFCWGVDRAVAMVRDAIAEHAPGRIWLLDQIIHNPKVNADFRSLGVRFVRGPFADPAGGLPGPDDVVVIPAFSATVEDQRMLADIGCTVIDTTCPWVVRPHKRTLKYVEDGFTTVIHGLVRHEETAASCSLIASEGGHYLVVADREEAGRLCAFLRGECSASELLERLSPEAHSRDFDPALHLAQVGSINQTTMLASETRAIEAMIRQAIAERDGAERAAENFRELNTICKATQDNQDAVSELAERGQLDLLIVVGGYDSSNTRNLTRVGNGRFPSFHVIGPEAIGEDGIRHRDPEAGQIVTSADWLPEGPITVAFTAGASTPDALLGDTMRAVLVAAGAPVEAVVGT